MSRHHHRRVHRPGLAAREAAGDGSRSRVSPAGPLASVVVELYEDDALILGQPAGMPAAARIEVMEEAARVLLARVAEMKRGH